IRTWSLLLDERRVLGPRLELRVQRDPALGMDTHAPPISVDGSRFRSQSQPRPRKKPRVPRYRVSEATKGMGDQRHIRYRSNLLSLSKVVRVTVTAGASGIDASI